MTVEDFLDDLIDREGGFTHDPDDRGGATKYGITAATLGEWRKLGRPATVREIQALPEPEARAIYTARYLRPFESVPYDRLRAQCADWGVTSGPVSVIRQLQAVLGVQVDGIIGAETRGALAVLPWRLTHNALVAARCRFYSALADDDASQRRFLRGWIKRAVAYYLPALLLVLSACVPPQPPRSTCRDVTATNVGFPLPCTYAPVVTPDPIPVEPARPPLTRLREHGTILVDASGQEFQWRGLTSFRLLHMIAHGERDQVDALLQWAEDHDVTVVRVLAMAAHLFPLTPEQGRAALPELLTLAAAHHVYVEVVALADTASYTFDHAQHVQAIGAICALHPSCLLELANEPDHTTQDRRLWSPGGGDYLRTLAPLVPESVLLALGAAHGSAADGSREYVDGADYVTVHEDRADGDNGWRWVRHRNDTREFAGNIGTFVVGDEPKRDDLDPAKHFAFGVLARMYGVGDTFHYGGGLGSIRPLGAEDVAFEARRAGWDALPTEWHGDYRNVGHVGSPVTDADWSTVLKVFASVTCCEGYVISLAGADPRFTWSADWPTRELIADMGTVKLWKVTR